MLDVSTNRGKIEISVGEPGRIVVNGNVTVRIGSASLPMQSSWRGSLRRLRRFSRTDRRFGCVHHRPPKNAAPSTINYQVRVPPRTEVLSVSDSGATTIQGIAGSVSVRTESGAIELAGLGATAAVTTGSGAVTVDEWPAR
jgi:DUF4097 and DUF4098 domain-containing protein YvlB